MPKRLILLSLLVLPALAQMGVTDLLEMKTLRSIQEFDRTFDGVLGVAAIDLTTGRTFSYHGDTVFAQASSIKIPILMRVFQMSSKGELRLEEDVTLTSADKVGGSGDLQKQLEQGPLKLSVRDLVVAMIRDSDNTATNWLIRRVGMDSVNRLLDEFGLHETRLRRIMMDTSAAAQNLENVSTPRQMALLVAKLYGSGSSGEMLDILSLVKAEMRKAVPETIRVASKPGGVPGVTCETGVILLEGRPFVLSVMGAGMADVATNPVGAVTEIVLAHFERLAAINDFGHRVR